MEHKRRDFEECVVFVRSMKVNGVQSCFDPNVLQNISFYVLKKKS